MHHCIYSELCITVFYNELCITVFCNELCITVFYNELCITVFCTELCITVFCTELCTTVFYNELYMHHCILQASLWYAVWQRGKIVRALRVTPISFAKATCAVSIYSHVFFTYRVSMHGNYHTSLAVQLY